MKIGMFTDSYRPYVSGVVRSIETVAEKLTELGHEVYIFAPCYPEYKQEARVFRFISVPTPTYPDFAIALPFSLHLHSTIKKIGLDIIHVHSPFSMGMLGARCAKRLGIPLVFTYHTMYDQYVHYLPFAKNISRKVILGFARNFCNRCDLVITPTEVVRAVVEQHLQTKVEVVPTGIDINEYSSANPRWLRETCEIADKTKVLLHLGRMGKEKNVGFLLQAFSEVLKEQPNTRLVIVGEGPERNNLIAQAEQMNLRDSVLFTGGLSRQNVINSYVGADVFVFASTSETQGLVLGEAKAAGTPVVAVKALGASEMVADGIDGFLTPLALKCFSAKVLELLENDKLREEMSRQAIIGSNAMSDLNMAKKIVVLYENVIQGKQRRAYSAV